MGFRATLDQHLNAIRGRDLRSLIETLPAETLTLVMSDGRLVTAVGEFIELHRGWFEQTSWSLDTEVVAMQETPQMGFATIRLDYRDEPPGGSRVRQTSLLTLIFALQGDRWVMILDQNTPIKGAT
jgi:ketosteroid isomerase-like protein